MRVKKLLVAVLSCTLAMFQFVDISAASIMRESTLVDGSNFESNNDITKTISSTSELVSEKIAQKKLIETGRISKVINEDDLVITETDITYQQLFPTCIPYMSKVQATASSYKSDFILKIFHVSSSKGKHLLRLDQMTEFQYNGTYSYVSDKDYVYYPDNGAVFVHRKSGYTSSSNKSKSMAKYWISGDIKWSTKKKSYTKHRVFTTGCTPKGTISSSLTNS